MLFEDAALVSVEPGGVGEGVYEPEVEGSEMVVATDARLSSCEQIQFTRSPK